MNYTLLICTNIISYMYQKGLNVAQEHLLRVKRGKQCRHDIVQHCDIDDVNDANKVWGTQCWHDADSILVKINKQCQHSIGQHIYVNVVNDIDETWFINWTYLPLKQGKVILPDCFDWCSTGLVDNCMFYTPNVQRFNVLINLNTIYPCIKEFIIFFTNKY